MLAILFVGSTGPEVAQFIVLTIFIALAILATKRFRTEKMSRA